MGFALIVYSRVKVKKKTAANKWFSSEHSLTQSCCFSVNTKKKPG